MPGKHRQEVFNVLLAQLLQERGLVASPEGALQLAKKRRMPDVIVNFNGLRTVIEGEVDDQADAMRKAVLSAQTRLEEGIAHIGIGVVYPAYLRTVIFENLKNELGKAELSVTITTESGVIGPSVGTVDYLESALRRAFEQLVAEDVVANAVASLDIGITAFANVVKEKPGPISRIAQVLGIRELPS